MRISAGRYEAEILSYGATLADLRIPVGQKSRSVVLGPANVSDYPRHKAFMGAIAGRCANRIAGGRIVLDGSRYQLSLNEQERTHLHGGFNGFFNRDWEIIASGGDHVSLSLLSPDGEEGYPGEVRATCRYHLAPDGILSILLSAVTTAPTLVNLATHSYFNLADSDTILDHVLTIPAEHYTPVDGNLVPTGEITPVAATGFDFRKPAAISAQRVRVHGGFDHNFALGGGPTDVPKLAAKLESPDREVALEIWSTEPGLQFYDGQYLPIPFAMRGRAAHRFGGCCLEPQRFPDAINHPHFPQCTLRPGETYRQLTQYRFAS